MAPSHTRIVVVFCFHVPGLGRFPHPASSFCSMQTCKVGVITDHVSTSSPRTPTVLEPRGRCARRAQRNAGNWIQPTVDYCTPGVRENVRGGRRMDGIGVRCLRKVQEAGINDRLSPRQIIIEQASADRPPACNFQVFYKHSEGFPATSSITSSR